MTKSDIVYLKGRKFQWSSTEASSLGMTFCTNKDNIFRANLEPKIKLFEKCLKQWQHRYIYTKRFLKDILAAWCHCIKHPAISSYRHEILWNNSNIKVESKTIMYSQ